MFWIRVLPKQSWWWWWWWWWLGIGADLSWRKTFIQLKRTLGSWAARARYWNGDDHVNYDDDDDYDDHDDHDDHNFDQHVWPCSAPAVQNWWSASHLIEYCENVVMSYCDRLDLNNVMMSKWDLLNWNNMTIWLVKPEGRKEVWKTQCLCTPGPAYSGRNTAMMIMITMTMTILMIIIIQIIQMFGNYESEWAAKIIKGQTEMKTAPIQQLLMIINKI